MRVFRANKHSQLHRPQQIVKMDNRGFRLAVEHPVFIGHLQGEP